MHTKPSHQATFSKHPVSLLIHRRKCIHQISNTFFIIIINLIFLNNILIQFLHSLQVEVRVDHTHATNAQSSTSCWRSWQLKIAVFVFLVFMVIMVSKHNIYYRTQKHFGMNHTLYYFFKQHMYEMYYAHWCSMLTQKTYQMVIQNHHAEGVKVTCY